MRGRERGERGRGRGRDRDGDRGRGRDGEICEGGRVKRERERMGDGRELGSKGGRERGWRERESEQDSEREREREREKGGRREREW